MGILYTFNSLLATSGYGNYTGGIHVHLLRVTKHKRERERERERDRERQRETDRQKDRQTET